MVAVNENTLEQAIIAELQDKGYEYLYGPDIDRDYHEVILEDCFRSSMININPGITQEILAEAYKAIKNLGLLKLEDLNASFHKYLIEGVPVPYQKNGESRTFTVLPTWRIMPSRSSLSSPLLNIKPSVRIF